MSAPRDDKAANKHERTYIKAVLEQAARTRFFTNVGEFVDYLSVEARLDRSYIEWTDAASYGALCELLRDHQKEYHKRHTGAGRAPSPPGAPGDSGYLGSDRGAGSPMSDLRMHPRASRPSLSPHDSEFDVLLVPAAALDAEPIPQRARRNAESNINVIDLESARLLCGDYVRDGQRVSVGHRVEYDGPDGSNTKQIQCVVGQIDEVNIVFSRHYSRSKPHQERSADRERRRWSSQEQAEFERTRARAAALLVEAIAEEDMRNRKRPPDDDHGSQRLAQRPRREG